MSDSDDQARLQDLGLDTLIRALRQHTITRGNNSKAPDTPNVLPLNDLFSRPAPSQESIAMSMMSASKFKEMRFSDISRPAKVINQPQYKTKSRKFHDEFEEVHELGLRSSFYCRNQATAEQRHMSGQRAFQQDPKALHDFGIYPVHRNTSPEAQRSIYTKSKNSVLGRASRSRERRAGPKPAVVDEKPIRREVGIEELNLTPVLANYKDLLEYKAQARAEEMEMMAIPGPSHEYQPCEYIETKDEEKIPVADVLPEKAHPFANKPILCPLCGRYTLIASLETHFRVEHHTVPRIRSEVGTSDTVGVRLNRMKYGQNNCACLIVFDIDKSLPKTFEQYKALVIVHRLPCSLDFSKYDLMKKIRYSGYNQEEEEAPIEPEHSDLVIMWVCSNLPDNYRFLLTIENDTADEGRMSYGRVHPIWDKNDLQYVLSHGNHMMVHSSTLKKEPGSLFGFEFQLKVLITKAI